MPSAIHSDANVGAKRNPWDKILLAISDYKRVMSYQMHTINYAVHLRLRDMAWMINVSGNFTVIYHLLIIISQRCAALKANIARSVAKTLWEQIGVANHHQHESSQLKHFYRRSWREKSPSRETITSQLINQSINQSIKLSSVQIVSNQRNTSWCSGGFMAKVKKKKRYQHSNTAC